MSDSDRTIAAALVGVCLTMIVAMALVEIPMRTPLPLAIIIPAIALAWIALHNIGKRA